MKTFISGKLNGKLGWFPSSFANARTVFGEERMQRASPTASKVWQPSLSGLVGPTMFVDALSALEKNRTH